MKKYLFLIILSSFLLSCKEFIEPSLEHQTISLLAPQDKLESNSYNQIFWWNLHEDALKYRLQIVSPKFDGIQKLILDTLIKKDKFAYTLDPGIYEWRVRAENGSSHTEYISRSLTIYYAALKDQELQVSKPANDLYTNSLTLPFEWLKLFGATRYRIQIDNNNFADENNLVLNATTDNLLYNYTQVKDGKFQARVRAENATENSKWSMVKSFTYDTSPPAKVTLSAPANGQTVSKPVKLTWIAITDAVKYEVTAYKDNSTIVFSKSFPVIVNTNSYTFNEGVSGDKISWSVKAIDQAGNVGAVSDLFSFTIQ
nr:hypothetical protein [Pedobacter sp. ASV2]